MTVVKTIAKKLSLRKALSLTGISNTKWYHTKTLRNVPLNKTVTETVQKIGSIRPTYGTRRMAAAASRELKTAVNRKLFLFLRAFVSQLFCIVFLLYRTKNQIVVQ